MDDVGRLCRCFAVIAAAAIVMGFFTLCGNAVLRISETRLNKLAEKSKKGKRIKRLRQKEEVIIQTNLAVRTDVLLVLAGSGRSYLCEPLYRLISRHTDGIYTSAAFIAALAVSVAFAAAVLASVGINFPKRLCVSGKVGEGFILHAFGLYSFLLALFKPLQIAVSIISCTLLRLCGVKKEDEEEQVTGEEILEMLDAASENGGIEDDQAEMISNIFEFPDLEIHEVMTHRTEISAVERSMPLTEAVAVSVDTGFSRIPVYNETIDDICGVIYIKDLLPLILKPDSQTAPVSEYMHKIKYVPETSSCGELFKYFTDNKKQIAVALDEYGGTAGIVTMEDLLECIVGNIQDEYDENEDEEFEEITPNTFDILGGADPDDVIERLGYELDEDHDYDTMGGFVTDLLGYIPADGETPAVRWKDITFCVIKAKDNRIEKIRAVKDKRKPVVLDEE